ncbi:MAG: NAD(P)H-dependent glycerol-3-phosphate dehydrogenase [Gammaproteobacteria bacterium]|nr:NAD(P)H-dependent glycerol-3-phosphate dehydrogenase [Gammaproteobacteria bacterium]MCW8991982.1 NAD(P)H-dependent glycerol-3-phosphate dehydrogenase [Gammaproteobacteria bacterium]MCW9087992.1 NAD(P)H-dependent glycerol-3-phosphate dehydrogenase [Gammaproteobacteria bacterium]
MAHSNCPDPIAVLGAGSWGTALAIQLARNGIEVLLWGRNADEMARMAADRCNTRYLPDIGLPEKLSPVADLAQTLATAADVLVVVPSHAFRQTLTQIAPLLKPGSRVAWATKGLEPGSRKLLHQVARETLGEGYPAAVISGPTFAKEVARGLPTAVTVASTDPHTAEHFAACLHGGTFRAYTASDVVGVELGGACKNVLAIAAGIADGLGYGANTRAALITRGLAELMRLGAPLGGHPETFMGLAGLGDLVLTCTDDQSRNRRVGLALGQGKSLEEAIASIGQAVEGVKSAPEVFALAREIGVEMPITEQVYRVLYEGETAREAVAALLHREQKAETD